MAKSLGVAKASIDATAPTIPDGDKMKWNPAVFDYFWIVDFSAGGVSLTASLQQ